VFAPFVRGGRAGVSNTDCAVLYMSRGHQIPIRRRPPDNTVRVRKPV
jgi:hypothetical protein